MDPGSAEICLAGKAIVDGLCDFETFTSKFGGKCGSPKVQQARMAMMDQIIRDLGCSV